MFAQVCQDSSQATLDMGMTYPLSIGSEFVWWIVDKNVVMQVCCDGLHFTHL